METNKIKLPSIIKIYGIQENKSYVQAIQNLEKLKTKLCRQNSGNPLKIEQFAYKDQQSFEENILENMQYEFVSNFNDKPLKDIQMILLADDEYIYFDENSYLKQYVQEFLKFEETKDFTF